MGYTNYTKQTRPFTDKQWDHIIVDVKKLFAALPATTPKKGIPGDGDEVLKIDDQEGNPPIANEEHIFFNGAGFDEADHETFMLTKKASSFSFCKTARKPYDLAVQACMLIAFHHGPDRIEISSDGDGDEWAAAVDLVKSIGVDVFNPELAARLVATKDDSLIRELAVLCLKQEGK